MKNFLLLCCAALLLGCGGNETAAHEPEVMAASVSPTANTAVTTGPVARRAVSEDIRCTGSIEIPPTDLMSIHARTSGQVSDIRNIPGDYVRKGDLLLRITNPELIPQQRILLETRANLRKAQKDLERQQILQAGDATTASALEQSQANVELLMATYQGLKSELALYGISIDALEKEGTYQSTVNVYANGTGYVHQVMVNKGMMITPTDQLLEIAGTEHLHLELLIPSQQIAHVKKDQVVTFTLPYSSETGTARIEKINPMVDNQTATLQVHCHFDKGPHEKLLPGLFVNASIATGTREVYGLPLDAVVKEGQQYFGFRANNGNYEKELLRDVTVNDGFVSFSNPAEGEWITGGAYYLGE